jgi:GTPase SAR1 family protein
MIVYDASERSSFEECDSWLAEAAKYGATPSSVSFVICANKIDKKRAVSEEEGKSVST